MKKIGTITIEIYQLPSGGVQARHVVDGINEMYAGNILFDVGRDILNAKFREMLHQLDHFTQGDDHDHLQSHPLRPGDERDIGKL